MPVKQREEKKVNLNIQMPISTYRYLEVIAKHYRTNGNVSHAVRLMIEDMGKGLEAGDLFARVRMEIQEGDTPL